MLTSIFVVLVVFGTIFKWEWTGFAEKTLNMEEAAMFGFAVHATGETNA
jgi:hypothetical protein